MGRGLMMGLDRIWRCFLAVSSIVLITTLIACSEPKQPGSGDEVTTGVQLSVSDDDNKPLAPRVPGVPANNQGNGNGNGVGNGVGGTPPGIGQIFGGGFGPGNGVGAGATGFIGNGGGFGFGGSIASIIGNGGGFGFGGFGGFASFFAGALPTTPPNGILLPPNAPPPPPVGNGATPPIGAGLIGPPAGFTPPAGGFGAGRIFGNPPSGAIFGNNTNGNINNNNALNSVITLAVDQVITPIDQNLASLDSTLTDSDLEFVFLSTKPRATTDKSGISILALTETVRDCPGGGIITRTNDDVEPVGLSTDDSRTTTFADCVRGKTTTNGSRGFVADQVIGMAFIDPTWSMMTTMNRDNLTRTKVTGTSTITRISNGKTTTEITVTDNNAITQQATGEGLNTRENADGATSRGYNFDVQFDWDVAAESYSWDFTVGANRASAAQQASIQADTSLPFSGTIGAAPTAGQLTVTQTVDAAPTSIVTFTALADGTVQVEIDSDADGVIDTTEMVASWDAVLWDIMFTPL